MFLVVRRWRRSPLTDGAKTCSLSPFLFRSITSNSISLSQYTSFFFRARPSRRPPENEMLGFDYLVRALVYREMISRSTN